MAPDTRSSTDGRTRTGSSGGDRAQTEPLAALVAVVTVCLAIGLYGVYLADVLPGTADRSVDETVSDQIWEQLAEDGAYDPDELVWAQIDPSRLPQGVWVSVNVTYYDGDDHQHERVAFDPDRTVHLGYEPAETADVYTRPIAVEVSEGNRLGGHLTVRVWSA